MYNTFMQKRHTTLIGLGGLAVVVLIIVVTLVVMNRPANAPSKSGSTSKQSTTQGGTVELKSTDEIVGTGAEAQAGQTVTVNYTGTLTDGTKFDSSYDRSQPFSFQLGGGQVIKGWDQGVVGMKVGGKRKLTIPPDLGYGAQAVSTIPANSTLVFEIELLEVK